jgi:hypothetical protein
MKPVSKEAGFFYLNNQKVLFLSSALLLITNNDETFMTLITICSMKHFSVIRFTDLL